MDLPELGTIEDYIPVPEPFHSFLEGGPFKSCTVCGLSLLEDGVQYVIEKAYHREEVIFEYAMCMSCRGGLMSELSRKSVQLVDNYFGERVDLVQRRANLLNS